MTKYNVIEDNGGGLTLETLAQYCTDETLDNHSASKRIGFTV